jgi:4-aminobutyrate aminotransferase-like enzyme
MPPEFVQALRRICDEHGIVYVDDEVQAGCGRTGTMWAIEQLTHQGKPVEPDLLVSGKTLGGGLPLAGVTGRSELMDAVHVGGLGGTFGGNPVACAAALAVLDGLTAPGFAERAEHVGSLLRARLEEIAARQPLVGEVRGLGPMLALELREPTPDAAKATTAAAFARGLLLLSCGLDGNVIRLLPPLTATDEELERGLNLLEEALKEAS